MHPRCTFVNIRLLVSYAEKRSRFLLKSRNSLHKHYVGLRQWLSKLLGTAMHPLTDYVTELTTTEKGFIRSVQPEMIKRQLRRQQKTWNKKNS